VKEIIVLKGPQHPLHLHPKKKVAKSITESQIPSALVVVAVVVAKAEEAGGKRRRIKCLSWT
jgi:hypothetical protein